MTSTVGKGEGGQAVISNYQSWLREMGHLLVILDQSRIGEGISFDTVLTNENKLICLEICCLNHGIKLPRQVRKQGISIIVR
jgi:hypothetical protein